MTEALIGFIVIGVCVAAVMAIVSSVYLWRLYRQMGRPRSWLFRALYREDGLVALIGAYYSYLVAGRFVPRLPVLPQPWNGIVFGFTVIILLTPPTVHAVTIYWRRRQNKEDL